MSSVYNKLHCTLLRTLHCAPDPAVQTDIPSAQAAQQPPDNGLLDGYGEPPVVAGVRPVDHGDAQE